MELICQASKDEMILGCVHFSVLSAATFCHLDIYSHMGNSKINPIEQWSFIQCVIFS